jgi:hypothetical protein
LLSSFGKLKKSYEGITRVTLSANGIMYLYSWKPKDGIRKSLLMNMYVMQSERKQQ